MNTIDMIILKELKSSDYHHPVSLPRIRRITKVNDRKIKNSIATLRMVYGIPIVSLRRWGYYVPANKLERQKGTSVYQSQIKTETATLMAILGADLTAVPQKINQLLNEVEQ